MKKIRLPNNKFALVDDEDYEWLSDLKGWIVNRTGYAQLIKPGYKDKKTKTFLMSRLVMLAHLLAPDLEVDHRDGNPLNNQKRNLRFCTHAENMAFYGIRHQKLK